MRERRAGKQNELNSEWVTVIRLLREGDKREEES